MSLTIFESKKREIMKVTSSLNPNGENCPKCGTEYGQFILAKGEKFPICTCDDPMPEAEFVYRPDHPKDVKFSEVPNIYKDSWTIDLRLRKGKYD